MLARARFLPQRTFDSGEQEEKEQEKKVTLD